MWVGYNLGCTMGFLMGHSAWQIDQFPTCWPMNGLFVHWSRGWGVSSFSERLVCLTITIMKMFQRVSVCIPVHFIYLNWQETASSLSNRLSRSIPGHKGTTKSEVCLIYICVQSLTIYQQLNFQYHSIKQSGLIYNHFFYCRWPSIYTI